MYFLRLYFHLYSKEVRLPANLVLDSGFALYTLEGT